MEAGERLETCHTPVKNVPKSTFTYDPEQTPGFRDITGDENSGHIKLIRLPYGSRDYIFTITQNGLYLLTRGYIRQGDVVVVLDGGKVPVVLQKSKAKEKDDDLGDAFRFVCIAYVHGFMDSEAEQGVVDGRLEKHDILIA